MGKHSYFMPLIMAAIFLAGCAGPTTPFGAISLKRLIHGPYDSDDGSVDTDDGDDDDDTEVAKKSSTAKKLVAETKGVDTTKQDQIQDQNLNHNQNTTQAQSQNQSQSRNQAQAQAQTRAQAQAEIQTQTQTQAQPTTPATPMPPVTAIASAGVTLSGPAVYRKELANARTVTGVMSDPSQNILYAKPRITFTPKRQVLHAGTTFAVMVDDPSGIPSHYELMLLYNGIDLTSKFLLQAEEVLEGGHPPTRLRLTFDHLHLLPDRDNKIEVIYWHNHNDRPIYASFYPPHCSAFKPLQIATTGDFEVTTKLVDRISNTAKESHLNPTYLAGLIAQESAFNEKAVSSAKALGLTQITGSGEAQVFKEADGWPRYPNINRLPSPVLKVKVMAGKINGQNEWRLNPDLSVQGGAKYLSYLNDYWRKPINYGLVANNFHDVDLAISQLILASYNSGPSRVNEALQSHGRRWLRDDQDLNEARKYVSRVMSYCDYFSRQEEDTDAGSP